MEPFVLRFVVFDQTVELDGLGVLLLGSDVEAADLFLKQTESVILPGDDLLQPLLFRILVSYPCVQNMTLSFQPLDSCQQIFDLTLLAVDIP